MPASDLAQQVFASLLPETAASMPAERFLAVPGNGAPRWLLPATRRSIDSVLVSWSPYRSSSRANWLAVRAAARAGCLAALPGVVAADVTGFHCINWHSLGWESASPPVVAIYLGTPGASRKAVIHLIDPASGSCRDVVKVPLTPGARDAILREADVLKQLEAEHFSCAPRLLHVDRERGISTQAFRRGVPGSRSLRAAYLQTLRSLLLNDRTTTIVDHAANWQDQLLWASSESVCGTMSAVLSELCDARPLPACWMHGDFAPWNIRSRRGASVALLDWEDAQPGALPLCDAFHFLHMQDYLFGARPSAHYADIQSFARSLGIAPEQGRKLEIAYLAHSYLQQLNRSQNRHCEFLLQTLQAVLHDRSRVVPTGFRAKVCGPFPLSAPAASPAGRIRADLFRAFIAHMNSAGLPYCILSGYENYPNTIASDVDFMVRPHDVSRIAPLLAQVAQETGARLVQAIPHETTACYFVLAKQHGPHLGFLDPDCSGDFRSRRRLWLPAPDLLVRRRRLGSFYVPAIADEFGYYLIKKVLKQSIAESQLRRLHHLHTSDPLACNVRIRRFWPRSSAALEEAIVHQDLLWMRSHLTGLCAELKESRPSESPLQRARQRLRDARRLLRRVMQPTGMSVLVCGKDETRRVAVAEGLLRSIAPAFRRIIFAPFASNSLHLALQILRRAVELCWSRFRSTLVVTSAPASTALARALLQPDLIFVLTGNLQPHASHSTSMAPEQSPRVVHLNLTHPDDVNIRQASEAILQWLSQRLQKRLPGDQSAEANSPSLSTDLATSADIRYQE